MRTINVLRYNVTEVDNMRLKKTISKNKSVTYSIIRDYKNLNGKRSTCIYELLGNDEKLKERFGS